MSKSMQWRDKASGFLTSSSIKVKNVTQTAGNFVGDVAKDAGSSVAEVAERAGTAVRTRWALLQQARQQDEPQNCNPQYSQDTVQERFLSAASSTSTLLKRSFLETKGKVISGKSKVEEAAKRAAQRSRSLLANIERWQKGQSGKGVFGVPLEILVQRQKCSKPIPHLVIKCVDYLLLSGLTAEYIFKYEGNQRVVQHLISLYNEDLNASIPEGVNPVDIAALLKVYFRMLPEPLLTFSLYDKIKAARASVCQLRDLLKTLLPAHYFTLECLMGVLFRISQKSALNKMDAHSLAFELAPVLLWKEGRVNCNFPQTCTSNVELDPGIINQMDFGSSTTYILGRAAYSPASIPGKAISTKQTMDEWDNVREGGNVPNGTSDISTQIPLDDEPALAEFAVIEAVQCFIEQHDSVFVDPVEAM
eukprot:c26662_g1_i1 orf=367-1623(-)